MDDKLRFWINGVAVEEDSAPPTTTLLNHLRGSMGLTGTKEGCPERQAPCARTESWSSDRHSCRHRHLL